MGNTHSQNINPAHVRIYVNLLSIQNVQTRAQMIQTLLAGSEYVLTAKQFGVYSHLLNYLASVNAGKQPSLLPYEKPHITNASQKQPYRSANEVREEYKTQQNLNSIIISPPTKEQRQNMLAKPKNEVKAIGYFQACLEVLGLEEEVSLTHESLKSAYKKSALRNHPDKGGDEKAFEKVTRAYAYLSEILQRIHGGRKSEGKVEAPNVLKDSRTSESKEWEHVKPVKLNPKNLDVDAFNKMFEQTRVPDPEEDGYGDWLKSEDTSKAPTFSGKFNRDVFNKMFDEEAKRNMKSDYQIVAQPEALLMAPTMGIEIGRGKPESYTAPIGKNMYFTDLKQAYTVENNISGQVASVQVTNRNYNTYKDEYGKAPRPLNNTELEQIQNAEQSYKKREELRQRRAAEEDIGAKNHFDRMKQYILMDYSSEK